MSDQVTIEVNGKTFSGWTSAQIVSGIEQIASQFAVSVTRDYPGDGGVRIRPGDLVKVKIGNDLVMTGYVDQTPVSYNGTKITTSVSGRSKTADLVDCCILTEIKAGKVSSGGNSWGFVKVRADGKPVTAAAQASQWRRLDLNATIAALIKPYDVSLFTLDDTERIVSDVSVSKGTKVFDALKKLVRAFNLVATDNENGDLLLVEIDHPADSGATIRVSLDGDGTNVIEGSCAFDYSKVYSNYEVYGQAKPQKSSKTPSKENNRKATAECGVLGKRFRLLRIFESGTVDQNDLHQRAMFESSIRQGKALVCTYKVIGWRKPDGKLWKKGESIRVVDDILEIDDEMMIGKVTFELSSGGQVTTLQVAPAYAYNQAAKEKWDTNGNKIPIGASANV